MPTSASQADWLFFFDFTENDWSLFFCSFCDKGYEDEWVLSYHIERNHGVMMDTIMGAIEEVRRREPGI